MRSTRWPGHFRGYDLADADGDGHLDLIAQYGDGEHAVWYGDGTGDFDHEPQVRFLGRVPLGIGGGWYGVAAGDMTGDGLPDLLIEMGATGPSVARGLGRRYLNMAALTWRATHRAWADVNGSGSLDPVFAYRSPFADFPTPDVDAAELDVRHRGNGQYHPHRADMGLDDGDGSFLGVDLTAMATGDIDADGQDELVFAIDRDDLYVVWELDPSDELAGTVLLPASDGVTALWLLDADGDGVLDLLGHAPTSGVLEVHLGDGAGDFGAATTVSLGDADEVLTADVTGDGLPELFAVSGGAVRMHLASGPATWGSGTTVGASDCVSLALGDLDADGLVDLVQVLADGTVELRAGFGNGAFSAPASFVAGDTPVRAIVTDLDGDGLGDVVIANRESDDLTVLRSRAP